MNGIEDPATAAAAPATSVQGAPAPSMARVRLAVTLLAWGGYLLLPIVAALLLSLPLLVLVSGRIGSDVAPFLLLVFLCGLPGVRILRSMSFTEDPTSGVALTAQEAPALFALIEEARGRIGGPRVDALTITQDFNAAAIQRAPRGMFGPWRNELAIGLPLLMAHDAHEIMGIIAHELGHFAGAHGRLHARIARTRIVWCQAAQRDPLAAMLARWYLPRFGAAASRLSRANEHDADRCEVMAVGSQTAARTLCRSVIAAALLAEFWGEFYAGNATGAKPDPMPYDAMRHVLADAYKWEGAGDCLREAMAEETASHDNHPCLKERLAAAGGICALPPPIEAPASTLLGPALEHTAAALNAAWWRIVQDEWERRGRRNGKLTALEAVRRPRAQPWGSASAASA